MEEEKKGRSGHCLGRKQPFLSAVYVCLPVYAKLNKKTCGFFVVRS